MIRNGVELPEDKIAEFCQRHKIRRLSLFGSILREDFGPGSDIDLLVEFEPDATVGFIRLAGIERELGELLGRKADMNTPGSFRQSLLDSIVSEAEVLYDGR